MSRDFVCPTFRKVLVASAFGACVFMIPNGVHSATNNSAMLQWAANQETDLARYCKFTMGQLLGTMAVHRMPE